MLFESGNKVSRTENLYYNYNHCNLKRLLYKPNGQNIGEKIMYEYMFNNLLLIEKYQSLYKYGIDVEEIKNQIFSSKFTNSEIIDYARFRVFLDQCLLLLNKEKMTSNLKRQLSFGDYLAYQKNDKTTNNIMNIVKTVVARNQATMNIIINEVSLFYSLDGKKYNPWQQGDIIRRAAAHAQYSTFVAQKDGLICYFFVDNIDEKKDIHGIVIEHIFHEWVKTFFSNYSTVGIPYKHSCISYHSFLNNNYAETPLWVTFKISNSYNQKYNGKDHPMRELGMKFRNNEELIRYVNINKSFFDITEEALFSMITQRQICAMQQIYSIDDKKKPLE